ncbi:MAG: MBL fold metallo-hydrolase [Bacteroidales bacterium]|nr:MBL fold metallo-hydrolase [Bacteroidales bacterium]
MPFNKWVTKSGYEVIQVLAGRSNVFVVRNGTKNLLVDTSVSRLRKKLQRRLDRLGVKTIDYLVLTHAHFDHAANAQRIQEKYNAKVIVQREDEPWLSAGDNALPRGTNRITSVIVNLLAKRLFHLLRYKPCRPDILVDSHFDLKSFEENLYLVHTPGHTAGSLSLIVDDELALAGDTLFGLFRWSVFPPYASDPETMVRSWGKLLETNCSLFLPSHGTPIRRTLLKKDYDQRIQQLL